MFRQPLKLAIGAAVLATTGISAMALAAPASAFTLNADRIEIDATKDVIGSTFTTTFDGNVNNQRVAGLSSEAVWTFLGITNTGDKTEASFEITLENTSSNGILSRTSALGFNVTDLEGNQLDLLGVGSAGGSGNTHSTGLFANDYTGSFSNEFGPIDVCFTGSSSCEEDSNGGVDNDPNTRLAQKASFTTTLAFEGSVNKFALNNFGISYQSINGEGHVDAGGTGKFIYVQSSDKQTIPEPGTLAAVLLTGLAIFTQRRKRQPVAS
ncbi:MAG: cistern family PEP-CTERM protein [Microcoleus vaginatus WJT46-NPBG5]|jgi:hypothetical protein|nr:cistern family PEP-CTERM protein [Microcoleus vaginatus WJT46-NPBG5]